MNINPKSYRLGNLLREVCSGQIVEVIGIKKEFKQKPLNVANVEYFTLEVSGNFPDGWQVEEIPLTIELIESLGFKKMKDGYFSIPILEDEWNGYCFLKLLRVFGMITFGTLTIDIDGSRMPLYEVKSVNDIQNIYNSITKQELDVSRLDVAKIPVRP